MRSTIVTPTADHSRLRDQAISACCLGAAAASDGTLSPEQRGRLLMNSLAVLAATYRGQRAPDMACFRRGLRGPLARLIPADLDAGALSGLTLLDDEDRLAVDVLDIGIEHLVPQPAWEEHWLWPRVNAEQLERQVYAELRRLRAADYVRARQLLVDMASGEITTLRRKWDGLLGGQLDFYEEIATQPWCQLRGYWFACPICRWPMRVIRPGRVYEVRCDAHARDGCVYIVDRESGSDRLPILIPTHPGSTPLASPVTPEHVALKRPVWRYVTLPGLLECELATKARSLGADVEMWPGKDRYDLKVTLRRKIWKVDAKAWASAIKLGDSLRQSEIVEHDLIIVIPDHQQNERHLLHHMIKSSGYRVLTAAGFIRELKATRKSHS
jgi:hypothetical protein